jgi:hypothetical protein
MVPPHGIRLFFDGLPRRVDAALGKRNFERDQIEQDRKAQLVDDRLLRFGENGKLHDAFLHCRDAIVKDADGA